MKYLDWDEVKNQQLKGSRGISFEEVVLAISEGNLLGIIEHTNKERYRNQQIFIVNIEDYIYLVPFIEDSDKYFLKTIFPSRKMTKKYLIERKPL